MPNTAKLLRLSFHDCVPYIGQDGEVHGGGAVEYCTRYLHFISTLSVLLLEYYNLMAGCDGCLNWFNMGFGYSGLNTDPKEIGYTPEGKEKV